VLSLVSYRWSSKLCWLFLTYKLACTGSGSQRLNIARVFHVVLFIRERKRQRLALSISVSVKLLNATDLSGCVVEYSLL
jgi:hypothetical protein